MKAPDAAVDEDDVMLRRPRIALALLLLMLLGMPVQALAATPAELTAALKKAPLYVDPALAEAVPEAKRRALLRAIEKASTPVFVAFAPLTAGDRYGGDGQRFLDVIHGRLGRDGVYVTAEAGLLRYDVYGVDREKFEFSKASTVANFEADDRDEPDIDKAVRFVGAIDDPRVSARADKIDERFEAERVEREATPSRTSDGTPRDDGGAPGPGVLWIAAVALLGLGGLGVWRRRRKHARPAEAEPLIPRRVFEHARSARAEELREDIEQQLVAFSEAIDARPTPQTAGGVTAQQAGLDAYTAARRVLQSDPEMVDLVGALVLTHDGARALAETEAFEAGRKAPRPVRLCFFDPRHGAASGEIARGFAVAVPACAACRRALTSGGSPVPLLNDGAPWFEGDSLWAKTGFGVFSDKLAARVLRGELRR